MKKHIVLSLLLVVTCVLFGQDKSAKKDPPEPVPFWLTEARMAVGSNYVETFAEAFKDPNILIGVFERPLELGQVTPTILSSGEILENFPGYLAATRRYSLNKLRCVKALKGEPPEPVVLVPTFLYIFRSLYDRPPVPPFIPVHGSKWVLALKKTSKEYRIARFGDDVEEYKFLNDRTVFSLFRCGHGALCLKWPEEIEQFEDMVKVPEGIVDDFEAIQRVVTYTQKEKIEPNELDAINKTSKMLKTDVAKSIFAKVLSGKFGKVQDPNDG
ncbi:MAG: hypothetical protein QHH07_11825 [Sedimentisphaerales bacterium]|nr:hypothetical protein [Sedimentisphaerales bacterium]